jgi:hypothetical protein
VSIQVQRRVVERVDETNGWEMTWLVQPVGRLARISVWHCTRSMASRHILRVALTKLPEPPEPSSGGRLMSSE